MKKQSVLTVILIFVGILMSCEAPFEEVITKDDDGNIKSKYTIRKEDGQKDGEYEIYFDGNLFEKGTFANDKQDGSRIIFYPDGEVQVQEIYENGNLKSKKEYFKNGNLSVEGQYDEAITMAGKWKYYYKNGQLKEVVNFKNNVENGFFKEYYKNGNIKVEGTYIPATFGIETEGVEQGELKEYNEEGKLIRKKQCENGRCKTIWELKLE